MRRVLRNSLAVVVCGLLTVVAGAAAATAKPAALAAETGISLTPESDATQCIGARQQWAPAPNWTSTIQLDTDQRAGGCLLGFGIRDLTGTLTGLTVSYTWEAMPNSDGTQCGNQGVYTMPVTQFAALGPSVLVDTDRRLGGCYLTFSASGRPDIALDVQFWGTGDVSQCHFAIPQGQYRTVLPGAPVTVGVDTDQRGGGCGLALRLRQL